MGLEYYNTAIVDKLQAILKVYYIKYAVVYICVIVVIYFVGPVIFCFI